MLCFPWTSSAQLIVQSLSTQSILDSCPRISSMRICDLANTTSQEELKQIQNAIGSAERNKIECENDSNIEIAIVVVPKVRQFFTQVLVLL